MMNGFGNEIRVTNAALLVVQFTYIYFVPVGVTLTVTTGICRAMVLE